MKTLLSHVLAVTLAASTAFTVIPATAGPLYRANSATAPVGGNIILAQSDAQRMRGGGYRGYYRGHHRHYRHYRHQRHYRHHWRHHHRDNWVGPAIGGLVTGAIIGGVIANGRSYHGGSAHVRWCYNRYRSYRASDNTFQPYHGPRRQCISPY